MKKFAAAKMVFERGRQYASILQFLLVVFLTVRELQRTNIGELIPRTALSAPIGLLLSIIVVMLVGYADYKLVYAHEQERAAMKNPVTAKLLKKLDNIERMLKKQRK